MDIFSIFFLPFEDLKNNNAIFRSIRDREKKKRKNLCKLKFIRKDLDGFSVISIQAFLRQFNCLLWHQPGEQGHPYSPMGHHQVFSVLEFEKIDPFWAI